MILIDWRKSLKSVGPVDAKSIVHRVLRVVVRGSGFSCVVDAGDGARYVMKLSGAGQGAHGLFHELIATRIARELGLRVPDVKPLWLETSTPWQVGTDEFDDALQRSVGWNLGIQLIDPAVDLASNDLDDLSDDFIEALAYVDAVLVNVDRTAKNPNLLCDARGEVLAIDFGACLYWSRRAGDAAKDMIAVSSSHFLADRGLRFHRPRFKSEVVDALFADVPADWLEQFSGVLADVRRYFVQD